MAHADQQQRLSDVVAQKYQVLCHIGGGGMAQVYLARHRIHGGLFAIKVLAEHLADDPTIVSRFEHEARMAASLASHPNIVPIFDIGEGNGLHYLVMQFIAGEDLASFLNREGRVTVPAAANLIAQATEGLSCAEARQIVHRDLKPANILLDETGRIKLLDFGIARIADVSNGLTRPGETVGTPHYMSPEQVRGESCDIRSDLYALGVVFFELLSGHKPFESESGVAVQIAHLTKPPPSLLDYDRSLPQPIDHIVQKLLAKRPEDRYQKTGELLEVLTRYGASTGPGTLRPSIPPLLQEAIRRVQELPLDRQTPLAPSSPVHVTDGRVDIAATVIAPHSDPSSLAVSGETAHKDRAISRRWFIVAVSAALLLALVGGVIVWLRPPTPVIVPNNSASSALPQVYSDAHGRMLLVPAGAFLFGSAAEQSAPKITLPAFYIDETEVSNAEYHRFCAATGHAPPQTPDYDSHPEYPVSDVTYQDASAYAVWAGKRLPTEEEWEKAARGTDDRVYPWGDAPWAGDLPASLQPVDSNPLRRSPYGAYNMAGNVWEWTATPINPSPAETNAMRRLVNGQSFSADWRVVKGGSFARGDSEEFAVAKHRGLPIDARSPWIGFRCVRNAPSGLKTP
ncbi:MAG: SUMF1/EgtB/PvdO family nonheme iron enzyme [Silvibacterium sp.]|nr:SUMF1/EgtB/PvdO family nonheme iron enzyme [Silvibacterium sp.]